MQYTHSTHTKLMCTQTHTDTGTHKHTLTQAHTNTHGHTQTHTQRPGGPNNFHPPMHDLEIKLDIVFSNISVVDLDWVW